MIDVGRICAVTFGDAVGAFVFGLIFGAAMLCLAQRAYRSSQEP